MINSAIYCHSEQSEESLGLFRFLAMLGMTKSNARYDKEGNAQNHKGVKSSQITQLTLAFFHSRLYFRKAP